MNLKLLLLLNCIVLVSSVFGFYTPDSGVISLTQSNFAEQIFANEHIAIVEFYAPWCGHCKSLKPEYEKAAKNLAGLVKVAAVNCDEEENKPLCGYFEIKGFPTIKIFPSELVQNPKGKKGEMHKVPRDYQGPRTASAIVNHMLPLLSNYVSKVTDKTLDSFLTQKGSKALLFTNKEKTSNLYKALSIDFHNTLALGEFSNPSQEIKDQYEVKELPTLLLFKDDDKVSYLKYTGKLEHKSLFKFLEPFQTKQKNPYQSESGEQEVVYDTAIEITSQEQFNKICGKSGICSVSLFDIQSEDDKESNDRYISHLNSLAKEYAGRIKIVWFDGSSQNNFINELNLSGLPNMVVLNSSRMRYTPYLGSFSYESLGEFYHAILNGSKNSIPLKSIPKFIDSKTKPTTPKENKKGHDEL